MHQLSPVRIGLDVGFKDGELPECFAPLKGGAWRSVPATEEFPFESSQFEAVVLDGSAVNLNSVREAHRVLKPDGCLYFLVPERTGRQEGFILPEIYAIVREGYNIVGLERPKWWTFGFVRRTFTICAKKKNWNSLREARYRPYV